MSQRKEFELSQQICSCSLRRHAARIGQRRTRRRLFLSEIDMPTEFEMNRVRQRVDAFGRPIPGAGSFAQSGERVIVPMMLSDAARTGVEAATARSLIFDYSDPLTYPKAAQAASTAVSDAYDHRCLALADAWRGDGSTGASVQGNPSALRDAALAIRDAELSRAWQSED